MNCQQALINALIQRPDKDWFEQACDDYKKMLDESPVYDADNYGNRAWLHREQHSYQTAERFAPNPEYLLTANTYLDRHYIAMKLRHIADSLVASRIFQEKSKVSTLAPSVKQIALEYYYKDPLIHIYLDIITFLQGGVAPEQIAHFEDFYFANLKYLSEKENQGIIKMIVNLYFYSSLDNQHPLPIRIVEWFKVALGEHKHSSRNFFLLNDVMPDDVFLNIAIFSATNHAFEFAHNFINQYTALLPNDQRENAVCLARCYVWLHEEKYDEIHHLLVPEEANNPDDYRLRNGKIVNKYEALIHTEFRYAIRARTVLIRVYLMKYLQHWSCGEHFLYAKDAFRKYLDYNAIHLNEHRKNSYRNFLMVLGEIYQYLQQYKTAMANRAKLIKTIETTQPLVCRQWIMNMIDKMPWQK